MSLIEWHFIVVVAVLKSFRAFLLFKEISKLHFNRKKLGKKFEKKTFKRNHNVSVFFLTKKTNNIKKSFFYSY